MKQIDWGKTLTSKTMFLGLFMLLTALIEYWAGLPGAVTLPQAISGVFTIITRFLTKDGLFIEK